MRLLLGLLKGGIIGGGLGLGFAQLGSLTQLTLMQILLYALIGGIVGFVAGKPFWRHDTLWTPIVKAVFGVAVGVGIYFLAAKALGDPKLSFLGPQATLTSTPYILGGLIGIVYGIFVEMDDSEGKSEEEEKKKKKAPPGPAK